MPWGLKRFQQSRQIHFVTFCCYPRSALLSDAGAKQTFECALERVRRSFDLCVYRYGVMPEHVHLLVSEPQRRTLADALKSLKQGVSRRLLGEVEHFWHTEARQYSINQGRWISPDPAGLAAVDPTNPQTWNRYAYVINNPVSYVDPSGLLLTGPGNTCIGDVNNIVCGPGGLDSGSGAGGAGGVGAGGGVGGFCDAFGNCQGICTDPSGNCQGPGGLVGGTPSPITLNPPSSWNLPFQSVQFGAIAFNSSYQAYLKQVATGVNVFGIPSTDAQYLAFLTSTNSAPALSPSSPILGTTNPPGSPPKPCSVFPNRSCIHLKALEAPDDPLSWQFLTMADTETSFWDFFY